MKLTQSELTAFLQGIGITTVEIVDKEEESEFDKDELLTAVDDNRKQILKPLIESEVKERLISEAKGTAGGSLRSELARSTGMKRADLERIEKDADAIKAAIDYKMGLIEGDKAETDKKVNEILEAHRLEKESLINDYDAKLQSANQKYIDRDINEFVAAQLKDAPIPKNADRNVLAKDFVKHLQDKYHLNYDEATKAAELYLKDKPDMPAMNAAKNAKISILDEAKEFLTPRGLWEKDMSGRSPEEEMAGRGQDYRPGSNTKQSLNGSAPDKKKNFMEKLANDLKNQPA